LLPEQLWHPTILLPVALEEELVEVVTATYPEAHKMVVTWVYEVAGVTPQP